MTTRLQEIQDALKDIVLTYIEAQRINIEPYYNAKANAAETHIRVIAEKRLPYLTYDLMKQLGILDAIEFEQPEASVEYVVQAIASIANFSTIWEQCLVKRAPYAATQLSLQMLFDMAGEAKVNYETLAGISSAETKASRSSK